SRYARRSVNSIVGFSESFRRLRATPQSLRENFFESSKAGASSAAALCPIELLAVRILAILERLGRLAGGALEVVAERFARFDRVALVVERDRELVLGLARHGLGVR